MKIVYSKPAAKTLEAMQPAKAQDIRQAVRRVAVDPRAKNNNVKPLRGMRNSFRIRVGDWRVTFTIDLKAGDDAVLDVSEIAPRGGAYRR